MRNLLRFVTGRNAITNLVLVAAFVIVICLGCGGEAYTVPGGEYLGVWSANGATLTLRPDGIAEYSSADLYLRENDVRIYERGGTRFALWSFEHTFKIDSVPSGGKMTLNGVTYQKTGNSEPPPPSEKLKIPSDAEIEKVVKETIGEYIRALETGNAEQYIAQWTGQLDGYDKERFQEDFAKALKNKDNSIAALRDAQTKAIQFERRRPDMEVTPQGSSFSFRDVTFPSQPRKTVVSSGSYTFKNGKWQFSQVWIAFE